MMIQKTESEAIRFLMVNLHKRNKKKKIIKFTFKPKL